LNSRLALAKQLLHMSLALSPFFFFFLVIFHFCLLPASDQDPHSVYLPSSWELQAWATMPDPPCLTHCNYLVHSRLCYCKFIKKGFLSDNDMPI
jgi:hypothetical protein